MPTKKYLVETDKGKFMVEVDDPGTASTTNLSSDQTAQKPHAEASIGPDTGGMFKADPNAVTLSELWSDPGGSWEKIKKLTAEGLSDPRNTIPAAVGLVAGGLGLGPRSFAATRGMVEPPAAAVAPVAARPSLTNSVVQAVKQNPDAAIDLIPMGRMARAGVKLARAVQEMQRPVQTPGGPVTPPEPPPAQAAAPAPSIPALVAAAEGVLTDAEMVDAAKWHAQGVPPKVIVQRIMNARELTARLGTPTPDEAAAKVQSALHTGKF